MKPVPNGWSRIASSLVYDDGRAAIQWLCDAFGFEKRLVVEGPDGALIHSELVFGEGVIMVAQSGARPHYKSPRAAGGNTQSVMVYVDDLDAHLARARARGAEVFDGPRETDHGPDYWVDRSYGAVDLEGHHWWFCERLQTRDPRWSEVRDKLVTIER